MSIATSAVRESRNGAEFVERLWDESRIRVETITGTEEAKLVWLAVSSRVPLEDEKWILVDLGGAETNSEMAIEMQPEDRQDKIVICNAPIVEGAVMAATESSSGASLEAVRATAEEYSHT